MWEGIYMERSWYIKELENKGYEYKWYKYSDKQIFNIYYRVINKK